ncbi:twin-arginine translocase TatA/TatE family subunit [Chloroflexota bacterium]
MFGRPPGWPEIVLILVVVMIVFGVGKLPQIGGAVGKSIRAFRKGQKGALLKVDEEEEEEEEEEKEEEKPKAKKKPTKKAKKSGA